MLKDFAEDAVRRLEIAVPALQSSSMLRVDIMSLQCGRLVVNEFESLEAGFSGQAKDEVETQEFLRNFWVGELRKVVALF